MNPPLASFPLSELRPGMRAAVLGFAWALLFCASPGVLDAEGSAVLATVALVAWAAAASRPGPRAFRIEWAVAAGGFAALMWWSAYVWWPGLLWIGLGQGVYAAGAGALLRRLRMRISIVWALPLAWSSAETLRYLIPTPLGLGWMRLGHHLHDLPAVAGSARVWGVAGLGFVLAAVAGAVAERMSGGRVATAAQGGLPLILALVLAVLVRAPDTEDGPRLLLVQPAVAQARKAEAGDPRRLFLEARDLSREGVEAALAAGKPPDLVCWGETMLFLPLLEGSVRAGHDRGQTLETWSGWQLEGADLDALDQAEGEWVRGSILGAPDTGSPGILPAGTSFLSGAEVLDLVGGHVRRRNAIALWGPDGVRAPIVGKTRLVPGAETLFGFERIEAVREFTRSVAGYVPDLAAYAENGVLELSTRSGRAYRIGGSVCFDNAYLDPYTAPLRAGAVDLHLVVSNEAWYRDSCEMDQMVAFSRLAAIATGRSLVRATNGGVTLAIGPDGREIARLRVRGRDRNIAGTLAVTVPVPVGAGEAAGAAPAGLTPFVRLGGLWHALFVLAPGLLFLFRGRSRELGAGGNSAAQAR